MFLYSNYRYGPLYFWWYRVNQTRTSKPNEIDAFSFVDQKQREICRRLKSGRPFAERGRDWQQARSLRHVGERPVGVMSQTGDFQNVPESLALFECFTVSVSHHWNHDTQTIQWGHDQWTLSLLIGTEPGVSFPTCSYLSCVPWKALSSV